MYYILYRFVRTCLVARIGVLLTSGVLITFGIPALVLMERAALTVYEEIVSRKSGGHVLILVGCGNNGADGLALARLLAGRKNGREEGSFTVEVVICGKREKATEQWKTQYEILQHFPVRTGHKPQFAEYDILVDALFGVGLSREIAGEYREILEWFNERSGYKVAVDMPSGVCADTGKILGCAARADLTVCFAYGKRGLYFYPGCEYAGETVVRDIGIGMEAFGEKEPEMFRHTGKITALLPKREQGGNKGTFGKVLLAAGSRNMAGAAVLCAEACYRSGSGMVKVLTEEYNREILQKAVPEALLSVEYRKKDLEWCDVLAVGPGLGTDKRACAIVEAFLKESDKPLVIDADGLNLLALNKELMALVTQQGQRGRSIILTPHVGEMARLCNARIEEIKENPVEKAKMLAETLQCVVVSKDARTLICKSGGPVCMNTTGNSGMAVAGSGDVLTGIIAGLLAQGMETYDAACTGVYLHGLAGEEAAARLGQYAMKSGDLIRGMINVLTRG